MGDCHALANFFRFIMRVAPSLRGLFCFRPRQAAPLTTKYYSLDLPADWVVVNGPAKVQDAVQVVMRQKDHQSSALIIVGPASAGEAEQAARANAKRLQGSTPVFRSNDQWEFTFEQKGVKGCGIVREDAQSKLLPCVRITVMRAWQILCTACAALTGL